jgi:hypothetical protein
MGLSERNRLGLGVSSFSGFSTIFFGAGFSTFGTGLGKGLGAGGLMTG